MTVTLESPPYHFRVILFSSEGVKDFDVLKTDNIKGNMIGKEKGSRTNCPKAFRYYILGFSTFS